MTRDEVLGLIRNHRSDIRGFGVESVALFGSAARDEAQLGSDVDVLVEFSEPVGLFRFLDLKAYLEALLGCDVDLVTRDALRPQLRPTILREVVDAF